MASADRSIRVYQELATHYDGRGEPQVRDRFLVLAADAATVSGRPEEAERLRNRLLQLNPHHMLKPYSSWSQALQSQDVRSYLEGLRRTYPPGSAENMLAALRTSNEDDRAPQPLPPAALEETIPYTPVTAAPQPPVAKPVPVAATVKETPTAIPMLPAAPPAAKSVVKGKPPTVPNGGRPPRPAPPVRPWWNVEPAAETERSKISGAWVSILLFYLVLAASLALGAYTFLRPFYPLNANHPAAQSRELKSEPVAR